MFSGFGLKFFNLDGASTHHMINEIGYKHALQKTNKNGQRMRSASAHLRNTIKLFCGAKLRFPGIISLDLHSGYYGPDGKWSKKISCVSHHMYNPITNEGEAVNNAIEAFKIAAKDLDSNNRIQRKIARFTCARGLHFVVDALTPAHHYGHKLHNIKGPKDWYDPHWNHSKSPYYNILFRHHGRFELMCAICMFLNRKKIIRNSRLLRKHRSIEPFDNPDHLKIFLEKKALAINQTRVYEKYLAGKNIKHQIIKETFPEIIHAVEIYVRSLYLSSATKKKHGKFHIRIPRPSDIKRAFLQVLVSKKSGNTNPVWEKYFKSRSRKNLVHNRDNSKQNS